MAANETLPVAQARAGDSDAWDRLFKRLAHGRHPESLGALAPAFLSEIPHDVITGEPLKYRLRDDGWFILYSVGWDEQDGGGAIPSISENPGDWVWEYPRE